MTLKSQTISNQLIDEFCACLASKKTPSEFEVARFKREANKLKAIDPSTAAALHGIIACLDGNLDECKKQHEHAIRLDSSFINYSRYFASLFNLGRYQDAYDWLNKGLLKYPDSPELLTEAITTSYFLGLYDKVVEHSKTLEKLRMLELESKTMNYLSQAIFMLQMKVTVEAWHQLSLIMEDVRLKHGVRIEEVSLIKSEDGLFKWIETNADVDTTVNMNLELCERMAEANDFDLGNVAVAFRGCQN